MRPVLVVCVVLCTQLAWAGCESNKGVCGDGVRDRGEECDVGEFNSDDAVDGCRTDCQRSHCGDGVLDSVEHCDDGNLVDGDGCPRTCFFDTCGNGVLDTAEACDGTDLGEQTCLDHGFVSGTPRCDFRCAVETRYCDEELVSGGYFVGGMALDETHVYFTAGTEDATDQTLMRVSRQGGPVTILGAGAGAVEVHGAEIYWISGWEHTLWRAPLDGGEATALAVDPELAPWNLVLDDSYAYYTTRRESYNEFTIWRVPLDGGERESMVTDLAWIPSFAVDAEYLYYSVADNSTAPQHAIMRIPVAGGEAELVAGALERPGNLVLGSDYLYWTNGLTYGDILRWPLDGGEASILANSQRFNHLRVGTEFLYWSGYRGLYRLPLSGGEAEVIVTGVMGHFVIGDRYAFWGSEGVRKTLLPPR